MFKNMIMEILDAVEVQPSTVQTHSKVQKHQKGGIQQYFMIYASEFSAGLKLVPEHAVKTNIV